MCLAGSQVNAERTSCTPSITDVSGNCDENYLQAGVERVMDTCCPPPPPLQPGEDPQPVSQCALPAAPTPACADVFLPFFDSCYRLLETQPNMPFSQYVELGRKCERLAGGVAIINATIRLAHDSPPECEDVRSNCQAGIDAGFYSCADDLCPDCALAGQCDAACDLCNDVSNIGPNMDEPLLLCFDIVCRAPTIDGQGVVPEIGTCEPGGVLDSICSLGCKEGFEAASGATEGRCTPLWYAHDGVAVAEYVGQSVTCEPERNADGTLGADYCRMERNEALTDCCASMDRPNPNCGADSPPETCSLECAELWLPLSRDCEQYFADFLQLTSQCEDQAAEFLGVSPHTINITGFQCHPNANGDFHIQNTTVRGKAHWRKAGPCTLGTDDTACYLYAIEEPHAGYAFGPTFRSNIAWLESYESTPPWGVHSWHEVCSSDHSFDQRRITLTPGFSDDECREYLELYSGQLTEACCSMGASFQELVAAGALRP
eukprot:SAG31_NODE_1321_length_8801_cov_7.086532_1_plen_488_part_10